MSNSKFVIDKLAKLFEQGLVSYKDLNTETDWIDFSNQNTSERIVGKTF